MIASEPIRIEATDGYPLAATIFRPPPPRPVERTALVCAAMGAKRSLYCAFAEYLAERGFAVVTFDYRGIGGSAPRDLRGFRATLGDWGRHDLAGAIEWMCDSFPDRRAAVVAHSVGGQIFGLAANNGRISDLLGFAAQSAYWGHWSGVQRLRVLSMWTIFIPSLSRLLGYFPSNWFGLGPRLPARVAREWAYWGRHPRYVIGRIDDAERRQFNGFRGRLRAVGASDDALAPAAAIDGLLAFYPNAASERHQIDPSDLGVQSIGHFGYFREQVGRHLWPRETDWLFEGQR